MPRAFTFDFLPRTLDSESEGEAPDPGFGSYPGSHAPSPTTGLRAPSALEVRAASRTAAGAAAVETEPDGEGGGPSPTPGPTPARQPLHFRLKACTITRTPQHPSLHKYLPPPTARSSGEL